MKGQRGIYRTVNNIGTDVVRIFGDTLQYFPLFVKIIDCNSKIYIVFFEFLTSFPTIFADCLSDLSDMVTTKMASGQGLWNGPVSTSYTLWYLRCNLDKAKGQIKSTPLYFIPNSPVSIPTKYELP